MLCRWLKQITLTEMRYGEFVTHPVREFYRSPSVWVYDEARDYLDELNGLMGKRRGWCRP